MKIAEAISFIKEKLTAKENIVSVSVETKIQDVNAVAQYIFSMCCSSDDFTYNTGDYLWFNMTGINYKGSYNIETGTADITFYFNYYCTADEEAQAVTEMNSVISGLGLASLGDAEKVKVVYEYLANNCTYDKSTKPLKWINTDGTETTKEFQRNSLHDVFINKVAVCQGFANTMFRVLNEQGVPTRIVQGHELYNGGLFNHVWNICKIGDYWYNVDATAGVHYVNDGLAGTNVYDWLLKNNEDLCKNKLKYIRFTTCEKLSFTNTHPMATESYSL